MSIVVVDASLPLSLATGDPRAGEVEARLVDWLSGGDRLHAPALLPYEVASGLARQVWAGGFALDRVDEAAFLIAGLGLTYHPLSTLGRVVEIARELERRSAYDAAYLALAERLEAPLWTLDEPLVHNASRLGFDVRMAASQT